MKKYLPLLVLLLGSTPLATAQTLCPDMVVTRDDEKVSAKLPVYETPDGYLCPIKQLVAAVGYGGFQYHSSGKEAGEIKLGPRIIARLYFEKSVPKCSLSLPDGTKRTVDLPSGIEDIGGTPVIDPAMMGWILGVGIQYKEDGFDLLTPLYWLRKVFPGKAGDIEEKPTKIASFLANNISFLRDFGVSPPGATHILFVRPAATCHVQIYAISGEGLSPIFERRAGSNERRDGSGEDALPADVVVKGNAIERAAISADPSDDNAEYVAVLTRNKASGEGGDPAKENDWDAKDVTIIGFRQAITPSRVPPLYVTTHGETFEKLGAQQDLPASLVRALNGFATDEQPKPGTTLLILRPDTIAEDDPDRVKKANGWYLVRPSDTVKKLAEKWNVSESDVRAANPTLGRASALSPGDMICRVKNAVAPISRDSIRPMPDTPASIVIGGAIGRFSDGTSEAIPKGTYTHILGQTTDYSEWLIVRHQRYCLIPKGFVLPSQQTAPVLTVATNNPITKTALKYIGVPYDWGGNSLQSGIDCSHFVAAILRRNHIRVPEPPVVNQESQGRVVHYNPDHPLARRNYQTIRFPGNYTAVTDLSTLKTGDRIIMQRGLTEAPKSRHTGIFLGKLEFNGHTVPYAMVHAGGHGVTITNLRSPYYWNIYRYADRD